MHAYLYTLEGVRLHVHELCGSHACVCIYVTYAAVKRAWIVFVVCVYVCVCVLRRGGHAGIAAVCRNGGLYRDMK